MRLSTCVVTLTLLFASVAFAQMGMQGGSEMGPMGMGGGMMGMGGGAMPEVIDIGPVWSPDDSSVVFSRVNASLQGGEWKLVTSSGGMGGMMGGVGMMGPGMMGSGMMGPGMMGGEGMMGMGGMTRANLRLEGLMQASSAGGGEGNDLVRGRTVVQDSAGDLISYTYQGRGRQGLYGIRFGGGGQAQWYSAILPWTRLSPDGSLFAIPYKKMNAIVFFPVQRNARENAGYCRTANLEQPVTWMESGDGVWVLHQPQQQTGMMGPGMMGSGMMGPGMMGSGMMGPGMMGMGGMQAYSIAIGKPDQTVQKVIENVGKESFAVSMPGGDSIAVCLSSGGSGGGGMGQGWTATREGIYIYSGEGEKQRKLTSQRAEAMAASPDGQYVAFMWGKKAPFTLSVAPVDGRPIRRVAYNLVGSISGSKPFSWSHDSRAIVFPAHVEEDNNGVFAVDIETGETERISTAPSLERERAPGE